MSSCHCRSKSSACGNVEKENYEADFIVVGIGAAGALVYRYLIDAGFSVIGIEAGGNYNDDPLIAKSVNAGVLEDEYLWKFFFQQNTEPNADFDNKTENYTTGRLISGGSGINGMQYVRSTSELWNQWASIQTNGSKWTAASIEKSYKQIEKFIGVSGFYDPNVHGTSGKLMTRQAPETSTQMAVDFATALAQVASVNVITDYNDPTTPIGTFIKWSLFQKPNGDRASSYNDFLEDLPNKKLFSNNCRSRILQDTTVTRVIFNCKKKAYAVEAIHNGSSITVKAKREIILCAGIYSNEILQRSGVGPAALLESLNIPVVFGNDNVGNFHRNHMITTAVFQAPFSVGPGVPLNDESALYVGGAFLPDPALVPLQPSTRGFQWIGISPQPGLLVVVFYKLKPLSVGTDRLQSKDPLRVSAVSENLFSNPQDLASIMFVYQNQIAQLDQTLKNINGEYALIDPPLDVIADNDKLKTFIFDNASHSHHFQSTCKMAPLNNGGVVSDTGEVHGVHGLRVADISTSPFTTDGNTAGPAFIVGYTIVQQIIAKYKK